MTRLEKIADLVSEKVVADIGCDHGFLIKILFEKGKISSAFACDISQKCLDKSSKNLSQYKDKVTFLCGDGLEVFTPYLDGNLGTKHQISLPEEVIISGMGGKEIIKILSSPEARHFSKFVLSPQKNLYEVRLFLSQNSFEFLSDEMIFENGIYYNLFKVQRTQCIKPMSEIELLYGTQNTQNPQGDFLDYCKKKISDYEEILSKKEVNEIRKKYTYLKSILSRVE